MTIAEACYVITDEGDAMSDWLPPSDGQARRAG
jgi:hypothetical protein